MLPLSILNRMRRELVEKLPQAGASTRSSVTWQGWSHPFPPLAGAPQTELSVLCREPEQAFAAAAAGILFGECLSCIFTFWNYLHYKKKIFIKL